MTFDFYQITGSEDSKQENFSSLCSRLLLKRFPDAKPVEGKGGDEGMDTFIGEFNGICQAFQHKYFIEKIGPAQRRQIEQSLVTAISHHKITEWTLMIPKDMNPSEIKWFQKLQQRYVPLKIDWWGKTRLQGLLASYLDVARDFQPKPQQNFVFLSGSSSVEELSSALNEFIGGPGVSEKPKDILTSAAEDIKKRLRLKILILGPGPSGGDIYKKRCELRERLRKSGHDAKFYEDVLTPEVLVASGLNLSVEELMRARAYDYIVCLMASPGSIGEVHDFAKDKGIASKMMICIDSRHKSGYSAQGVIRIFEGGNGKTDWFEYPTDIEKCHLSTRVLDQIQKVAEAKQWEVATRGSSS